MALWLGLLLGLLNRLYKVGFWVGCLGRPAFVFRGLGLSFRVQAGVRVQCLEVPGKTPVTGVEPQSGTSKGHKGSMLV